jgi:hypothetical protein
LTRCAAAILVVSAQRERRAANVAEAGDIRANVGEWADDAGVLEIARGGQSLFAHCSERDVAGAIDISTVGVRHGGPAARQGLAGKGHVAKLAVRAAHRQAHVHLVLRVLEETGDRDLTAAVDRAAAGATSTIEDQVIDGGHSFLGHD